MPIFKIFKDNQILVKIALASLCHFNLMLLDGSFPGPDRPVILGHKAVRHMKKCGASMKGFKAGDQIGFLYIIGCCCKFKDLSVVVLAHRYDFS